MLDVFAETVRADGIGPVADLGCGPGKVTAHLAARGVPMFGVDLSPAMVGLARRQPVGVRREVPPGTRPRADGDVLRGLAAARLPGPVLGLPGLALAP
ncbi:methyltransferase domain-containing protein [Streptomyces xanthophaeus]|uniref:methyltransferase domain-containing protein n=1 Tax=Streptomyces xanthophaeus TaxID=67385 RepID=UPI0036664250